MNFSKEIILVSDSKVFNSYYIKWWRETATWHTRLYDMSNSCVWGGLRQRVRRSSVFQPPYILHQSTVPEARLDIYLNTDSRNSANYFMVAPLSSADKTVPESNLYEARVPRFYGALDEDYKMWDLRIETTTESQQLADGLTSENVDEEDDGCICYKLLKLQFAESRLVHLKTLRAYLSVKVQYLFVMWIICRSFSEYEWRSQTGT